MNIMVFDVPAESGGALSVLQDFYHDIATSNDQSINWIFVLSTPSLKETANIRVLKFPWIKKSWGHRFYFDQCIAHKLVKQYEVDKVISLQNVAIPHVNCEQILYVHQSLPFVDYRFSFKENKLLWVYQNIIGRFIMNSIKKAQHIIVQTEWMKTACIEKTNINSNNIEVLPPNINIEIKGYFEPNERSLSTFFYPANGAVYKNHQIIVDACRKLKSLIDVKYDIIFTLNGDENKHIEELYRQVQEEQLPIRFEGTKSREEVFDLYTKSILLFPSYIETFGLPLLEARIHKGIIIAADLPFAHEILDGYENAYLFDTFHSEDVVKLLKSVLDKDLQYKIPSDSNNKLKTRSMVTLVN